MLERGLYRVGEDIVHGWHPVSAPKPGWVWEAFDVPEIDDQEFYAWRNGTLERRTQNEIDDVVGEREGDALDRELDSDRLTGKDRKLMKLLFKMVNMIRTNNGQSAINKAQFIRFVKGL